MAVVQRELTKCFFWRRKLKVVLLQLVRRGLQLWINGVRIELGVSFFVRWGLWKVVGRLELHEHGLEELHNISLGARIKWVHLVVQYLKIIHLSRGLLEIWRFRVWSLCKALLKINVAHLILLELSYPGPHITFGITTSTGFLRPKPWWRTEFLLCPAATAVLHHLIL